MSLEKERVEALQRVIDELRDEPGALMPIMQRAQDIFGYLPEDVQKYIAKEMDIPVSDVYGVATFYAQFNLEPKGQYTISVCMGTACYPPPKKIRHHAAPAGILSPIPDTPAQVQHSSYLLYKFVLKGRNSKRSFLTVFLGYVYPFCRIRLVRLISQRCNDFVYSLKTHPIDGFPIRTGCHIAWFGVNTLVSNMKHLLIE